jgi:cytochrome b6-f complex iron-sulfur subunit
MADKKKMSVAEILAAARKGSGGASEGEKPAEAAPVPSSEASAPAAPATGGKAAPMKTAGGGRPSVAEMLAAARAGGGSGASTPAAEKVEPAEKKVAPKPTAKPPAAEKSAAASPVARDTASILAAVRKSAKPGPMTKSEAAAKDETEKPKTSPVAKEKQSLVVPPMPQKPDYAKAKGAAAAKAAFDDSRRGFMATGFWGLGAFAGLWTLATVRFMFPNVRREPPSKFKVGLPDAFPLGQVQEKYKAQYGIWIVNTEYNGESQIVALKTVCTHLGCTPNWLEAEQKFKCPCHGSGYYKDGINFEGPAPRPLERYAIHLADDGQIEVDKSRTFQEELGQWADPACYIPA